MTTVSTQASTVIVNPYSGDYRVDVLLFSADSRWNFGSQVGTPVKLTYSFMSAAPSYGTAADAKGFSVFTDEQKVATRQILALISQQWNIDFTEVSDTSTAWGTLRFGNNDQGATSAGYATAPDTKNPDVGGDTFINNGVASNLTNVTVGTQAWVTLVHEIGHAIGLKHPGNYNAGEPASPHPDNFLAASEDTEANSIMSYISPPQGQATTFFSRYDILALNYLYGTRAYLPGDTTYAYKDVLGTQIVTLNDGGGTDTIDLSGITVGAKVSLEAGSVNSAGIAGNGSPAANNLYIAYGATIENLIGTPAADVLTGNAGANQITGGGGNDTITGGAGVDTALWAGARASFNITKTPNGFTVADKTGKEGTDSISGIESLKFSDVTVNLGMGDKIKLVPDATLKSIIELYIAYFNRTPDASGVSYWIDQAAAGVTLDAISRTFYGVATSAAYSQLTGYSATMTSTDFIKIIYKNVLGRSDVDQGGLDYWNGALAKGTETRESLVKTILSAAHGYKGDPTFGSVANLLDNKYIVGRYVAVEQGLDYNNADSAYATGVAIAAKVTPTDTSAAIALVGINDTGFTLG